MCSRKKRKKVEGYLEVREGVLDAGLEDLSVVVQAADVLVLLDDGVDVEGDSVQRGLLGLGQPAGLGLVGDDGFAVGLLELRVDLAALQVLDGSSGLGLLDVVAIAAAAKLPSA